MRTPKADWFVPLRRGLALLVVVAPGCGRTPGPMPEHTACERDGIVSSRVSQRPDAGDLAAEIVQTCADCQSRVRPGAPPGSPCTAASVCREFCCNCMNSLEKSYRARVCDAARCAGREACALARAGIRPDVCD